MMKELTSKAVDFDPFAQHGELERTAPATEGQTEIWTALSLSPEATLAYNESLLVRVGAALDSARLQRAFTLLIATHDALRMSFSPLGRTLHVSQEAKGEIRTIDLTSIDEQRRREALAEVRVQATQTPFDLSRAPLIRIEHILVSDSESCLCITAHHLITDGWSLAVILKDLADAYSRDALAPAPSFAAFAEEENRRAGERASSADQRYWIDRFADGGSILELPIEGQRPALRSFAANRADALVPASIVRELKALARKQKASYVAVQLAAFAILLARLTQESDIALGMPSAGQAKAGLGRMVGHAVHLLPLRIRLNKGESFLQLVARVKSDLLDAHEHQDFTFGELLKALPIERDASRIPLVPVMFNVDTKLEPEEVLFAGTPSDYESNPRFAENFELFLNITESSRETTLECQYNTALFSAERMATLLDAHIRLLASIAKDPSAAYETLAIGDIHAEPLARWNATERDHDRQRTLVDLLRESASNNASRIALEAEDGDFRYEDLWNESARLRDELIAAGVAPKSRVGICLNRTSRMLIAQLAVLRAGASYIPLDPAFPQDRLEYMIEDGRMALVLAESSTRHHVAQADAVMVWENRMAAPISQDAVLSPDDPAYMIYTSGSTGRPKGVAIAHGQVVNFLGAMSERLEFPADARLLAVTTLSFDIAVLEIFMPLISGGTIILAGDSVRKDGFLLLDLLRSKRINLMQATPSTWRMLLSLDWRPDASITLLCGGEAFPPDLKAELKGAKEVWNLYGPTEATVWVTAKRMSEISEGETINVGRPIGNTRLYVLDQNRQLLPPGVKGEVYIAGENLAIGYWQRPELDAEKFVSALEGEGRLYQTGDIGRFTRDGELEILGRVDAQIKLRGYRIELGEIESCILEAEGVRSATVILHEAAGIQAEIIAYVTWSGSSRLGDLRQHLGRFLPDYMIPQTFMELEALPLLPNGKINRKALPSPVARALPPVQDAQAWEGPTAEIAALWMKTLGRPAIAANDDFFLIGGHSLLAIQMLAQMNKQLGTQLTLRDIFQHARFDAFARHALASTKQGLDAIAKSQDNTLSFAQERMWYVEQLSPGPVHNLPGAWLLHGDYQHQAWLKALSALHQEHEVLNMAIRLENGAPVRTMLAPQAAVCPYIDYSARADGREVALKELEREAESIMPIESAPLIHFKTYKLGENLHLFSIRVHHLIWDGWSFDLFWTHINELYSLALQGRLEPRGVRSPGYADFSSWQRGRVEARGESYQYWTQVFASVPEPLDLPLDRPRPAKLEGAGETLLVPWSARQNQSLEEQAVALGTTPFILSMAVLVLTLHRLSGQNDIVVGTPLRGRTREEFEQLFGLFINVMPLRFAVDPESDFPSFLAQVKKVCLDGFAQQEFPFESLVSSIKVPRDESRTPLYTAMFSYQDVSERVSHLEGLDVEQVFVGGHGVPTDIVFWMKKTAGGTDMGIDYRTKLWDRSTVVSFGEIYQQLQAESAKQPSLRLKDLSLFPTTQGERVAPLTRSPWNGTDAKTLSESLLASLETHPDAIIRSGREDYSYSDLLRRAKGVANALRKQGVKAGDRVGLCTDRSIELLAGMFGILLADAAYVPFDPSAPRERLRVMAEQAELKCIVTQEDWLDILPLSEDRCVLVGETKPSDESWTLAASPSAPAYAIFTSGSTGTPKAVQISQAAAIHFLQSMQERISLKAEDVCLALTTAIFDISVLEIFGPLLQGATIILAESAFAADGEALSGLVRENSISFMQMTPSGWRILLDAGWEGSEQVRAITGGEALPRDLLQKLKPRVGTLWNAYGPTEATVWATLETMHNVDDAITIGRPLPGYETFVLNSGKQAPIGVWGELHLGGPALADGYIKDPSRTAERFIAHELAAAGRLYATGDIARLRGDGRLEFKSRADTQVKIRGYRIELEEIESIALKDARVKSAAAKVFEPSAGDQRLVLFVASPSELKLDELMPTLRSHLPKYMWPSLLITLPSLPLTANGKLNRLALPTPDFRVAATPDRKVKAPGTVAEQAIAGIWKDLLGVERISVEDNFFDLGGHSLLTLKMLSRINQSFSRSLKLRDVLTTNLEQLAQLVDAEGAQ